MKTGKSGIDLKPSLLIFIFLACFVWNLAADEIDSPYIIDRLLSLTAPVAPEIVDNSALFTFSSNSRRIGISFAHEGFSRVHWFRKLLIPQDPLEVLLANPDVKDLKPEPYKDSGILFHVMQIPADMRELEYRLIIDGLWTVDPHNPVSRKNKGMEYSVLTLPARQQKPEIIQADTGSLNFTFSGPPGETITVAGSFNNWDPFMYELKEYPAGNYSLALPLPPGKYQYIFFHRGERHLDPYNPNRAYSREGRAVSEVVLQ